MNAEALLAHYERIAEAPDAIARLRRFVLDLAVRGKLVPQDVQEEPATVLLGRIRSAKAKLGLREATDAESGAAFPFDLPSGWAWASVGGVCSKTGSGSTPRGGQAVYKRSGVPFLRSQNVYDDGLRMDDVAYIDAATHERMAGTAVKPGDLLLNITGGSIGRCCRIPAGFTEANVSQHVAILRPAVPGMQEFLHALILSPYFQSFVIDEQTGAGRGGLPKNRMDRIDPRREHLMDLVRAEIDLGAAEAEHVEPGGAVDLPLAQQVVADLLRRRAMVILAVALDEEGRGRVAMPAWAGQTAPRQHQHVGAAAAHLSLWDHEDWSAGQELALGPRDLDGVLPAHRRQEPRRRSHTGSLVEERHHASFDGRVRRKTGLGFKAGQGGDAHQDLRGRRTNRGQAGPRPDSIQAKCVVDGCG